MFLYLFGHMWWSIQLNGTAVVSTHIGSLLPRPYTRGEGLVHTLLAHALGLHGNPRKMWGIVMCYHGDPVYIQAVCVYQALSSRTGPGNEASTQAAIFMIGHSI